MQMTATSPGMRRLTWITAAFLLASVSAVGAQVVIAPPTPQIGSSNPVTAEPPVPRPHTKPCVVQLFQNLEFADFNHQILQLHASGCLSRSVGKSRFHRRFHGDRGSPV